MHSSRSSEAWGVMTEHNIHDIKRRLSELYHELRAVVRMIEARRPENARTWLRTDCERWETWDIKTAKLFARQDVLNHEIKRYKAMLIGKRPLPKLPDDPERWRIAISKREKPKKTEAEYIEL